MRHMLTMAVVFCLSLCCMAGCKKGTCDETLLPGLWTSAHYTIEIGSDFTFEAAGAPNLTQIDVSGTIDTDGCGFNITDTAGTYACPDDQVGKYTFTVTASELRLTAVEDPCDGRRIPLDGAKLKRG
jgi:hypothetical protein